MTGKSPTPESLTDPAGAAAAIRDGKLALLPTETVYAVASLGGSSPAVDALFEVCGLADSVPLAWHAASLGVVRSALDASGATPGDQAWEMVSALLPGPVTVALELDDQRLEGLWEKLLVPPMLVSDGASLLIRVPDHPVARAVLERVDEPVVMAACRADHPLTTLSDARIVLHTRGVAERVTAWCDGPPTPVGQLSTHVAVGRDGSWRVLRDGPMERDEVRRRAGRLVVFACTGNTCRSPMAEAIARRLLEARRLSGTGTVRVVSAGVFASAGSPATPEAVRAAAGRGADLSDHTSRPLDADLLGHADAVFVMTRSHLETLSDVTLPSGGPITLLDASGQDVPDPIGGPQRLYDDTAARLETLIERRLLDAGLIGDEDTDGTDGERA